MYKRLNNSKNYWNVYRTVVILVLGLSLGQLAVHFIELPASAEIASASYATQDARIIARYVDHVLLHSHNVEFE